MFRVVVIQGIVDHSFNEDSFIVEPAFFFTIKHKTHYLIYNKNDDVIGVVPEGYNMFFKVDEYHNFEDIDMENVLRLFNMGEKFYLVGTRENSDHVHLFSSETISAFKLVESEPISIPFTNNAFDSEGVVVFKNMKSLAESLDFEAMY